MGTARKPGTTTKALGRIIADKAKDLDWSQVRLAAEAGLPGPTVNQIINGRRVVDAEQLTKLAAALGFRASELMALAEER